MENTVYYTIGQFMKITHVTKKTLRYYDEHNILKPSKVSSSGARFYTQQDIAKMQQILLLKYLGFSLADIKEMTIQDANYSLMETSLNFQKKLIENKIEQLNLISKAIDETKNAINTNKEINWSNMLEIIHSMRMEQSLKNQYLNSNNISTRINLHTLYSHNKQGWFPWIFENCNIKPGTKVLEIGCGDGYFWKENFNSIPKDINIVLSDKSKGMLADTKRNIGTKDTRFNFECFECENIPYQDDTFDLITANHVLFYCTDIDKACSEIRRVLKPSGTFICSTYGSDHMKEINQLVTSFDDRISLSKENLYNIFGRENGKEILENHFNCVNWKKYDDYLLVNDAEPIISYVMSCHGNQTQYILDRYKEFEIYVSKSILNGLKITKDAGIFICNNKKI